MSSLFDLEQNPPVDLAEAARERYLHYAVSVITSRALPDARDGLKPVQRRILYTMWHNLRLRSDARYRKSAKVVGEVMGSYHPHGDQAIYDALVRMAQPWAMRHPLVDGSGNFGSLDGDGAAAMRYTECRLARIADELLEEIGQDTVDFRDNYDSTAKEPQVLPSRFPNLLVSGATGIAVGMATSIPPHNLSEVTAAATALIRKRKLSIAELLEHMQGPDFPTGGTILNTREELLSIYTEGQGSIRLQGDTVVEKLGRGKRAVVITSIPYMVTKSTLVEKIGELIGQRKVPQLVDVRDESTTDVRIVCELGSGSSPDAAIAYLYRHTPLRTTFPVNLTALVPGSKPGVTVPERLDLREALLHFIDFRYVTVRRRLEHELARLRERIHVLEGFAIVFDALDEAIRIIRRSDGKPDAAKHLSKRFGLDDIQTEAILETKLYRLARLEIDRILEELAEKRSRAAEIEKLLASTKRMWSLVEKELSAVAGAHADRRRTAIGGVKAEEIEFDPEAYIESTDTYVVATRDGWVKRQQSIRDPRTVRMREGDEVLAIAAGNTRECVAFLSSHGVAYVIRINDIPATTGYGEPIQKLFKFADGERLVAVLSLDPRFPLPAPGRKASRDDPDPPYLLAVSARGLGSRFSLAGHREPSTRSGRRFARVKKGDEIIAVCCVAGDETCITASAGGRVLLCPVAEINLLAGPGTGVIVHKLDRDDRLVGAAVVTRDIDGVQIETNRGAVEWIRPSKYRVTSRAGRGFEYIKRGSISRMIRPEPSVPEFPE